jgi:hypothetical protein
MSASPIELRTSLADELLALRRAGRDRLKRDVEEIRRQQALAAEVASSFERALDLVAADELRFGREAGAKELRRLELGRDTFARMAERDRRLLAELEAPATAEAERDGTGATPRGAARKVQESRSSRESEFSRSPAPAPSALVEALCELDGLQDGETLERLRARAAALSEQALADFVGAAPWRSESREHWAQLSPEQRADWLEEALASWA